jgi:hypothetical protein
MKRVQNFDTQKTGGNTTGKRQPSAEEKALSDKK